MLLTGYVIIFLVLELVSVTAGGGYLDNLANALAFIIVVLAFCSVRKLDRRALVYALALFSALIVSLCFSLLVNHKRLYWLSVLYEISTLMMPIVLLPLLSLSVVNRINFYRRFFIIMLGFCWVNVLGLLLQHIFGPDVLPLSGDAEVQLRRGRPTGFFANANVLADFFLMILFSAVIVRKLNIEKLARVSEILLWSCVLLILLSSSKHAILCVLIVFFLPLGCECARHCRWFLYPVCDHFYYVSK